MKMLWEYIKCRRFYALLLLVLDGLFTLMFWLTQADGSAPMYMLLLFTVLELAAAAIDLRHFAQRHRDIQVQLGRIFAAADGLPEPDSLIEADYQELVRAVCAARARARSEADWLVGLNVTRALTCKHGAQLSAGRVQTPTLAMIVAREEEIRKFVHKDYYYITASAGGFRLTWRDKKSRQIRLMDAERARQIMDKWQ